MTDRCTRVLDPVQGLVDYVNDIKPFHTKIVEVLTEYVYNEQVRVSINESTLIEIMMDLIPSLQPEDFLCTSPEYGFGAEPFGSLITSIPVSHPDGISTPLQATNFADSSVYVLGDHVSTFPGGSTVLLTSVIENHTNTCSIVSINRSAGSPPMNSFEVLDSTGVFGTSHNVGDVVWTYGPTSPYKPYTITDIQPDTPVVGTTTVVVSQSIPSGYYPSTIGVLRTIDIPNSGEFTVSAREYKLGTIDSWPDINDPSSYIEGWKPYTVLTFAEPMTTPTLGPGDVYNINISTKPVVAHSVLPYSNLSFPDEGNVFVPILSIEASSVDNTNTPQPNTGTIEVAGNYDASNLYVGDTVRIYRTDNNNGVYTIHSIDYNQLSNSTILTVAEILTESTTDEGSLEIKIPSNVFIIDEFQTIRFRQGKKFKVTNGSFAGEYTTLTSTRLGEMTAIRPTESIIANPSHGYAVVDAGTSYVTVPNNVTAKITSTSKIVVTHSSFNNGCYDVDSVTYDNNTNTTTIHVMGALVNQPGGYVFPYNTGLIQDSFSGLSDDQVLCALTPEGLVRGVIHENIQFEGMHLDFRDNVLVYNMENTDTWGYDTPTFTLYSDSEPVISTTEPTLPDVGELWLQQSGSPASYALFRWSGLMWKPVQRVYWANTETNLLYQRTVTSTVDTGWVLQLNEPAFYADHQFATGNYVGYGGNEPHQIYHSGVEVITNNSTPVALSLPGGNYVYRFENQKMLISGYSVGGSPQGLAGEYTPTSFPIISIDTTANSITVPGDLTWLFTQSRVFSVKNSITNLLDFIVDNSVLTSSGDTEIVISHPTVTNNGQFVSTIHQIKDGGNIVGAVYDPVVHDGTSPRTIFVPAQTPLDTIDAITYRWIGPLQMTIGLLPNTNVQTTVLEQLGISEELMSYPIIFDIVNTNALNSTIEVQYQTTSSPVLYVDLTPLFPVGETVVITGSFNNGSPTVTNDGDYVVIEATYNSATGTTTLELASTGSPSTLLYDNTNTMGWTDGYVQRDGITNSTEGLTAATITDEIAFSWGTTERWTILDVTSTSNIITVSGNKEGAVKPNDNILVKGSFQSDGGYVVVGAVYNINSNSTDITVQEPNNLQDPVGSPPTNLGVVEIEGIDVTDWFQFSIKEVAPLRGSPLLPVPVIEITGNAIGTIQSGQDIEIYNNTNAGIFTVSAAPVYNAATGTTDVPVSQPVTNAVGGWVQSVRDGGLYLRFGDQLNIQIQELVTAESPTSGGSLVDSWDYTYWDLDGFDANTTVLTLTP